MRDLRLKIYDLRYKFGAICSVPLLFKEGLGLLYEVRIIW